MLDNWTFLDDTIAYTVIIAVVTPFLLLLFFTKTAAYWARRQITSVPSPATKRRERVAMIAEDKEFVKIITSLSHLEKFNRNQKSLVTVKNKTRLMLKMRKRIAILFPEMEKDEVEYFCGYLYSLTRHVPHKKNM
jgi:hypothetical protein